MAFSMNTIRFSAAAFLAVSMLASAQTYPSKPVRLVVPFAAGGAADTVARAVGDRLSQTLGQPVVIDDRGGGGATIGADIVAKAAPDGYTLLMAVSPPQTTAAFFLKNVPYDNIKDFTPIALIGTLPQVIAVHPSLPVHTLRELIDYAKKNPGKLSFGTSGIGTAQHLGGLQLNKMAAIDLQHIGYKGGSQAVVDLLGGQIPIGIVTLSNVIDHARAGKLRMIAVLEAQRAKAAPEVPTVAEAGLPGYAIPDTWIGLVGPARLPAPIVGQLNRAVGAVLEFPDVRSHMDTAGFEVRGATQEAFAESIPKSYAIFQKIVNDAGIKPE
jgi:tripartite-type tricarboxylate transporter receptor subunit TctC